MHRHRPHQQQPFSRRRFVKSSLAMAAAIPVVTFASRATAADLPQLDPSDPTAVALKYVHDATQAQRASDEHICANCIQYTGEEGTEWGPCTLFPGKAVAAAGWCAAYVMKPA